MPTSLPLTRECCVLGVIGSAVSVHQNHSRSGYGESASSFVVCYTRSVTKPRKELSKFNSLNLHILVKSVILELLCSNC